jgi:SpoVK/Ycf46/Vps4 family AAA+-type ATPase
MLGDELQATLDELVVELEYRDQLAARNLAPRSRLLFYGPPGNGKTSCASAIASALGLDAYVVSLPDLVSQYIGGTGANLGKLFDGLNPNRVVVFDELDAIGSSRGDSNTGSSKEQNATVNVMLTLMDRAQGIIIATTNRLEIIDPALKRRFDESVHFPAPSVEQMRSLAVKVSAPHAVTAPDVDDCANFDEVTKRCLTHARREAMRQILADEAAEGEQDGN